MNLIYRTFHPNAAEYTFFSSVHRTFSRATKQTFANLRKLKSYQASFLTMRLEINYKERNCKKDKHMEAKQFTQ